MSTPFIVPKPYSCAIPYIEHHMLEVFPTCSDTLPKATPLSPSTWFWSPTTPFFEAIAQCHKCVSWFKLPIFLTPEPPLAIGEQTIFHATKEFELLFWGTLHEIYLNSLQPMPTSPKYFQISMRISLGPTAFPISISLMRPLSQSS